MTLSAISAYGAGSIALGEGSDRPWHAMMCPEDSRGRCRSNEGVLIRGKYILTSAEPEVVRDGAVRVVGDTIHDVGPFAELSSAFPECAVFGGPNGAPVTGSV